MARKYRKLACLAKIETVYGTDSVPTGAANAIQLNNVTLTPIAGSEESRDLMLPYLGHQGVELTGDHIRLEFSVEIAGAGAAGDVPGYGVLLRACARSETITVGVDVAYEPVSDGEEAVSIYYIQDGVRHVALGVRGNVRLGFTPQQIPRFNFTLTGLLGIISDQALPVVDLTAFQRPKVVNKANTTFSLHGYPAILESLEIDLGNQIETRLLIGSESVELTDRQTIGTSVVQATDLATKNWFAAVSARTKGALQLVHGTVAGHIVQIDAPSVELGRPTQGQTQGIVNYSLPLMFTPVAGNDELVITVK